MSHIFISYSKKNREYANQLADELRRRGFDIWIDDEIDPGEDWWSIIRQAIRVCAAFTIVMTPESEASHWVQLELLHALEFKKPIFPLFLAGDPNPLNSDIWSRIANIQFTNVQQGNLPPDAWYKKVIARGVPYKAAYGILVTPDSIPSVVFEPTPMVDPTQTDIAESPSLTSIESQYIESEEARIYKLSNPLYAFQWCFLSLDANAAFISKLPVTNAQYRLFLLDSDGYENESWWDYSSAAQTWRKTHSKSASTATALADTNPCTSITWYETVAFCRWLGKKLKIEVNLPTQRDLSDFFESSKSEGKLYEWCLNKSPEQADITWNGGGNRTIYNQLDEKDVVKNPPQHADENCGFRVCIKDYYVPFTEINLEAPGITEDESFRINTQHKLWELLQNAGARLIGNANRFSVQTGNRVGSISYQVRRAYIEAAQLDLGGYNLRDAVWAGDSHPFWRNAGLDGVPLLWGASAIVFYSDKEIPHLIMGLKKSKTDNNVAATFAGLWSAPAGIVNISDFTEANIPTLRNVFIAAAKREFKEETGLDIPPEAAIVDAKVFYEIQRCKQQSFIFIQTLAPLAGNLNGGFEIESEYNHYVDTSKIADGKIEYVIDGKPTKFPLSPECRQAVALLTDVLKKRP